MFGKFKPPTNDLLNARMRNVVARPAASQSTPAHAARAERHAVFRNGALILPNGQKMAVAIKNLSETGARIEYFVRDELPSHVTLIEPTLKIRKLARVVWQNDHVAGLAFD